MDKFHSIVIAGKRYTIDDTSKLSKPDVEGKDGQVLSYTSSGVKWVDYTDNPIDTKKPIAFTNNDSNVITLDITNNINAYIGQVTVLQENGEKVLPMFSDEGVYDIIKETTDDKTYLKIMFGTSLPEWESGYIYLTEPVGNYDKPTMGYDNEDLGIHISGYYGYIDSTISIQSLTAITSNMIKNAVYAGTVTKQEKITSNLYTIEAPAGSWAFALVPEGYSVLVFNGIDGYDYFDDSYDEQGNMISCNGKYAINIDGIIYYLYGSFKYNYGNTVIMLPEIQNNTVVVPGSGGGFTSASLDGDTLILR